MLHSDGCFHLVYILSSCEIAASWSVPINKSERKFSCHAKLGASHAWFVRKDGTAAGFSTVGFQKRQPVVILVTAMAPSAQLIALSKRPGRGEPVQASGRVFWGESVCVCFKARDMPTCSSCAHRGDLEICFWHINCRCLFACTKRLLTPTASHSAQHVPQVLS